MNMDRRSFLKTALAGAGILVTGVGVSSFLMREDGTTNRLDHVDIGFAGKNVEVGDLVYKNRLGIYDHADKIEDVWGVVEGISLEKGQAGYVRWAHVCRTGKALVSTTT